MSPPSRGQRIADAIAMTAGDILVMPLASCCADKSMKQRQACEHTSIADQCRTYCCKLTLNTMRTSLALRRSATMASGPAIALWPYSM